ncbi:hypothetical protein ACOSQ2_004536 [Xanthoceras sorbifolium]
MGVRNVLHSDNQSTIHLAKNSVFHSRTKHICLCYHFNRPLLDDEVLTKPVTTEKLELCGASISLQG